MRNIQELRLCSYEKKVTRRPADALPFTFTSLQYPISPAMNTIRSPSVRHLICHPTLHAIFVQLAPTLLLASYQSILRLDFILTDATQVVDRKERHMSATTRLGIRSRFCRWPRTSADARLRTSICNKRHWRWARTLRCCSSTSNGRVECYIG